MSKEDSLEHLIFRELIGAGFNHHDGFFGTAYCEVEVRDLSLLECRVADELAVYSADNYTCSRAVPWDVRNSDGCRCSDEGCYLRGAVMIYRESCGGDYYIVPVALWEKRSERSVDKSRNESRFLARTAFSLDISARDLSYRVQLFFKVACQREEIYVLFWLLACANRAAYDCFAVSDGCLSVCLLGELSDLYFEKSAAQRCSECSVIFKSTHFLLTTPSC